MQSKRGEDVLFTVTKETPTYIRGELVKVISASPARIKPECAYYGRCGGCQFQHMPYEMELECKRKEAVELIRRIAGLKDFQCEKIVPSPDPYHYRSSITLHKGQNKKFGYFAANSHNIVEIGNCPIAEKAINAELEEVAAVASKDELTIKTDHAGGVWISDRPGERFFRDKYGDTEIFLSPKAFSQCNRFIAAKISETLGEWIGEADSDTAFFDVYSGAGLFSFSLKNNFGIKIGMDIDRVAIDCAKTTAKTFGHKNVKFYRADAEKEFFDIFEPNKKKKNIVLLDPPRAGVEKVFLENLAASGDITGLYCISCDPARLARDIKIILASGRWKLARTLFFDMFPRTSHIETLAEFVKQ